jgi:hypothetical protein
MISARFVYSVLSYESARSTKMVRSRFWARSLSFGAVAINDSLSSLGSVDTGRLALYLWNCQKGLARSGTLVHSPWADSLTSVGAVVTMARSFSLDLSQVFGSLHLDGSLGWIGSLWLYGAIAGTRLTLVVWCPRSAMVRSITLVLTFMLARFPVLVVSRA